VYVRHPDRHLVGIDVATPAKLQNVLYVTVQPECRVTGSLTCSELVKAGRNLGWTNVYLELKERRGSVGAYSSLKQQYEFFVPPGEYRLQAYGDKLREVYKPLAVKSGDKALTLASLELPATKLALLEGQPAPDLRGVLGWKNTPVKLADLKGKVVLLDFWGYWCGPCIHQMPEIVKLHEELREKGLVVVGVHVDVGDDVDTAAKLDEKLVGTRKETWKRKDIPFPVALTSGKDTPLGPGIEGQARGQTAAAYGIAFYPTTVLIDRKGLIVGQFYPNIKSSREQLEKLLKEK
jgi:thiol-disulfide isomerase/thioredoxin